MGSTVKGAMVTLVKLLSLHVEKGIDGYCDDDVDMSLPLSTEN